MVFLLRAARPAGAVFAMGAGVAVASKFQPHLFQQQPQIVLCGKKEVHIKDGSCPRVAICFSGKAGLLSLDELVTSLPHMTKLIDELGPADVFASVADESDKEAVTRLLAPKKCEVRESMPDGDLMRALGGHPEFHVKKDTLDDLKDEKARKDQAWVNGIIFWAINHAHTLAIEEEVARRAQYDIIVRVRYDLIFQENTVLQVKQLITELLDNSCGEGARPILIVPMINNFGGVNDQFGFGNRQAMQAYADTFKKYRQLAKHAAADAKEAVARKEKLEPGFFVDLQTEKCLQRSLEVGRVEVRRNIILLPRILRHDGTTDDICA